MIIQLNPPLPVTTPKGKALAHFMIDDGVEYDIKWVCFLEDGGECRIYKNGDIRAQGREYISPFYDPKDVAFPAFDEFIQLKTNSEELKKQKDNAYWERNQLVRYISTLFPSWIETHPKEDFTWDKKWGNIIFIQFPQGLYSWHIHTEELQYFEHLSFREGNSWDGSSTEDKYKSLREKIDKKTSETTNKNSEEKEFQNFFYRKLSDENFHLKGKIRQLEKLIKIISEEHRDQLTDTQMDEEYLDQNFKIPPTL